MNKKAERLEILPTHLNWLAGRLGISNPDELRPDFESLLEHMPSGLYGYPESADIVREGERSTELYVVYSGELSVWRKQGHPAAVQIGSLRVGDFFGEISFLMNSPRSATVRAETKSRVFRFKASEFLALMKKHKELDKQVRKIAQERIEKIFLSRL